MKAHDLTLKSGNVPTIRGTLIRLIGALQEASDRSTSDPVKYATLKAYQEGLVKRLTAMHTRKGN